jgi:hypothetical protein
MIIFRFLALVLIVAALMVLGYDAITSLRNAELTGEVGVQMLSLGDLWTLLEPASKDAIMGWGAETDGTLSTVINTLLTWPAFAVLGVIGVVFAFLFRARED